MIYLRMVSEDFLQAECNEIVNGLGCINLAEPRAFTELQVVVMYLVEECLPLKRNQLRPLLDTCQCLVRGNDKQ